MSVSYEYHGDRWSINDHVISGHIIYICDNIFLSWLGDKEMVDLICLKCFRSWLSQ